MTTEKLKSWAEEHRYKFKDGAVPCGIGKLVGVVGPPGEAWMLECRTSYDAWAVYPDLFNKDQDVMIRPHRRRDCSQEWVQHCHDRARRARAARKMAGETMTIPEPEDEEDGQG